MLLIAVFVLHFSESHKAMSCFLDASRGLLVDHFLMTMMNHVSQDHDARHLEVLYYFQVSPPVLFLCLKALSHLGSVKNCSIFAFSGT